MNDFYKKSLSELLYESNKNEKLNESLVYTKGITSLLNESEETNRFKDISSQPINMKNQTDVSALIKAIDDLEEFTKSRHALSVHDSNSILAFIVKHQNKCKVMNPNLSDIKEVTAGNFAQILMNDHSDKTLKILVREFYEGPIYDNITAAITSSPSQTQSQTQGSSQDPEEKSLRDLAKNFNPNNASYEDYLDIFKAAEKYNFESEDTKKKVVQDYLKAYSNKIKKEAEKNNETKLDPGLEEKFNDIVDLNLITRQQANDIIEKINAELDQAQKLAILPTSEPSGEETPDAATTSEEAIRKVAEDLPPIENIREVESSIESQDEKIKRLEKSIEEILDIKKEEDFDPNNNNYLSKLEEIEKNLQEFSQLKIDLEEISQYKNKDIFDTAVKTMEAVNQFEENSYKTIDNLLRNDPAENAGIAGEHSSRNIKELIFSDSDLNGEKWQKFFSNCVDSFNKKDENPDSYAAFFGELSEDAVKKYVASVANISNCVTQRKDILEVFKNIASIINKASGYKVKSINASAFLDDADFSEFIAAFKKVQEKNDQDIKSFAEKYEKLSGKRADFLKKKDDEIKDVDNFEDLLKNDIDVLFEPFKKLGIEINFDTIFENKEEKYLSGKLSNFLFEDSASSSTTSLNNPEEVEKTLEENANKGGLKHLIMHLQIVKGIKQQQKEKEVKIPKFILDLDQIIDKTRTIVISNNVVNQIAILLSREFMSVNQGARNSLTNAEIIDMTTSSIKRVFLDDKSAFESKYYNKNILNEGAIESALAGATGAFIGAFIPVPGAATVGGMIGSVIGSKFDFITSMLGDDKDVTSNDIVSELMGNNVFVDTIKIILMMIKQTLILEYFVGIEESLKKFNVELKTKKPANLRALRRKISKDKENKSKFDNISNEGTEFIANMENVILNTMTSLPFGEKFGRMSITSVSEEFKRSKEMMKLLDAFSEKSETEVISSGFVYKKGLSYLVEKDEGENKKSNKKNVIVDVNKLFLELRDISNRSISKTRYNQEAYNNFVKSINKLPGEKILTKTVAQILSRYTKMSTSDIQSNLFESKNKNLNILSEKLIRGAEISKILEPAFGNPNIDPKTAVNVLNSTLFPDVKGGYIGWMPQGSQADGGTFYTSDGTEVTSDMLKDFVDQYIKSDSATDTAAAAANKAVNAANKAVNTAASNAATNVAAQGANAAAGAAKPGDSIPKPDAGNTTAPVEQGLSFTDFIPFAYYTYKGISAYFNEKNKSKVSKQKLIDEMRQRTDFFSTGAAVNIAYRLCKFIEINKKFLEKSNIKVVGALKESLDNEQTDDKISQNLLDDIKSNAGLTEKFKDFFGRGSTKKKVDDKIILKSLRKNLSTVAIGITKLYDKPRYAKIIKASSSKQSFDLRRESFVSWYESNNSLDITNILTSEKEINKSEKLLSKEVAKDVDKLALFLLSFSKQVKGIKESKVLHKNKLVDLLFEAPQRIKTNVKDLVKGLRSSGILIYGSSLKPSSREFKEAENHLIGTIADFLYTNFDIEVEGAEQYNKLDPVKVNVERAVNKDAQKGEVASEEIEEATSASGAPLDMNQPASIEQLVSLANMSGGNMMMMFMMMMMNQNFMQMMMQMQKDGASLQDMTEKVAEESDELSDFDKEIAYALKEKRAGLPEIGKREVKRIFKLLNDNPFRKLTYCNDLIFNKELKDQRTFITKIRQYFNVTDKKVANYKEDTVSEAFNFITTSVQKKNYKQENDLRHSNIEYFALYCMLDEVFDVSFVEMQFKDDDDLLKKGNENQTSINQNKLSNYAELDEQGYIKSYKQTFYDELEKQVRVTKKEAQRIAEKYLTESSKRYNKPILRRKVRKSKVISESEFLKNELKRLWKL